MEGPVTLKDIAEKLGLSISTVSRALRNHPDTNPQTLKAVQDLAKKLEYEPNQLALNLLKKRSNVIGVIVPKIGYHLYAEAISGMEEVAWKAGLQIMICQSNESEERERAQVKELIANRVAGLIVSIAGETKDLGHFSQIQKKKIPLVLFNREASEIQTWKVKIDNVGAGRKSVEHLVANGYKRIAFLAGPKAVQISNKRLEGYKEALVELGLPVEDELVAHAEFSRESAIQSTKSLLGLSIRPDALIAFSDQMAIGAMIAINESGLKIPSDIGILGFNNEPVSELISPGLTSIDQPGLEMGQLAAGLLLDQIFDKTGQKQHKTEVLETQLVVRGSSERGG